MKIKNTIALALIALGTAAFIVNAQDSSNDGPPPGGPGAGGPPGQDGRGMGRRPVPAIVTALDVNREGVIDADEIANAVTVLKKLDKNSDGKLTRDEYLGKPPGRPGQGGAGGPPPQDGAGGPPEGNPPPQQQ